MPHAQFAAATTQVPADARPLADDPVARAAQDAEARAGAGRLRECPDCGLLQRLPALPRGAVARCPRCAAVLRRRRVDPTGRALALATTGLLLFALALTQPFIDINVHGLGRAMTLLSGPVALEEHGAWPLAIAVLVTVLAAPLARLACLTYVLLGIHLPRPPRHLHVVFRWVTWLGPWSMAEVFMLGVLVAYTRLVAIARVDVGIAVYALGALSLANAAAIAVLDPEAVWRALEQHGSTAAPPPRQTPAHDLHGCDSCGFVAPNARPTCPRCGAWLRRRKTDSLRRTWALLLTAALLYIPANVLPVLTYTSLGAGTPATILGGVAELARAGLWPLAALVFFASITVPMLKLLGLGWLLVSTQRRSAARLRERTVLYRIVEQIGRWSMIDVFMISILTALVRMGFLASVWPQPGAIAFCAVVVLTMLAAQSFDPRLMWDAAAHTGGGEAP